MAFVDTQVRPQGEQMDAVAPAKMKLSAAIRIGAKIRPQTRQVLFDGVGTCALGAAAEARGWTPTTLIRMNGKPTFPYSQLREVYKTLLWDEIGHRNDSGESRESIADWLESQGL